VPAVTAPEEPSFVDEIDPDGWFAYVRPVSVQLESPTA
jgi:hypothetical protein